MRQARSQNRGKPEARSQKPEEKAKSEEESQKPEEKSEAKLRASGPILYGPTAKPPPSLTFLLASGFRLLTSPFLLASGFWLLASGFSYLLRTTRLHFASARASI
jgi:hypothetical protein